jgi:hypothetical protein
MTPKEKALELYNKFYDYADSNYGAKNLRKIGMEMFYAGERKVRKESAKQCALIAVDEILSDYKNYLLHENTEYKGLMYWQEVKNEIEKL